MNRPAARAGTPGGWVLLAASLGLACSDPPPPLPLVQVRIVNPASLAPDGAGGFIPEVQPSGATVRFARPPGAGISVRCVGGAAGAPSPLPPVDARGLTTVCAGGHPLGEGAIVLSHPAGELARLTVRWVPKTRRHPLRSQITKARAAGDTRQVAALIEQALSGPEASAWPEWRRLLERARFEQGDAAVAAAHAAAKAATDRPLDAARAQRLAAHHALWSQQYHLAGERAADARMLGERVSDEAAVALARYYQGLVDQQLGRFRAARAHLDAAVAGVVAVGRDIDAVGFGLAQAHLHQDVGDHRAALAALDTAAAALDRLGGRAERMRGYFGVDRGWIRLRAMAAGALPADYAREARALEALEADALPPGPRRANARVNRAWAAMLGGDLAGARRALDAARDDDPEGAGFSAAFAALLDIELALAEEDPQRALQQIEAAAARVEAGAAHLRWRVHLLAGRAHMQLGDVAAAEGAWRAGLARVQRQAGAVGVAGGRSAFHADRGALTDELIAVRLAAGDPAGALLLADAERARVLRGLAAGARIEALGPAEARRWAEALAAWRAARDAYDAGRFDADGLDEAARPAWHQRRAAQRAELGRLFDAAEAVLADRPEPTASIEQLRAALPPGHLMLAFHRLPDRWIGFAVEPEREAVEARTIDPADPLAPWRDGLPSRRGLLIVDGGLPAARDLPLAPDHRPWTAHVPVRWLPAARLVLTPPIGADRPGVVIADPTGDLPHARAEGRAVAEARSGARVVRLVGSEASRAAFLEAARGARWLHFAGHGALTADNARSDARSGPWQAHLALADGPLTAAELLVSRAAPAVAVLSGCETARQGVLSVDEAWGLPEVLVALGARAVLAADVVLDDAAARRFVQRFYAAGGVDTPGLAFRSAVAESIIAGDDGWRGWRLVGRP